MEEVTITKSRFKYSGMFSLGAYYDLLFDTLRGMGYHIMEKKYKQVIGIDGNPNEIEIKWECLKEMDGYARIVLLPETLVTGLSSQQTQIDGKSVNMEKGTLELAIKAKVILDKFNRWEINYFLRNIRKFYDMYFYKNIFNSWKAKVADDLTKLHNTMKAFLDMYNI